MFNKSVRKKFRRFMAFAMAATVTATSCIPASLQNVYAADVDEGTPFGKNVAVEAAVTVTYPKDGETDKRDNAGLLVDGKTNMAWEAQKKEVNGENVDRPADIVVDLKEIQFIDRVTVHWNTSAPAKEYKVFVSEDNKEWTEVDNVTRTPKENEPDTGVATVDHTFDAQNVRYVKVSCETPSAWNTYAIREIEVYTIGSVEEPLILPYALNRTVGTAAEGAGTSNNLNDGQLNTMWRSGNKAEGSIDYCYIDLGKETSINQVIMSWNKTGGASSYTIDVATEETALAEDNITKVGEGGWKTVATEEDGQDFGEDGVIVSDFVNVDARYVKLTAKTATGYGLEVWEMEINNVRDSLQPESIYLDRTEDYIFDEAGDTVQLYAQVLPANAEGKEVTWSSSDDEVATVDQTGIVTAKKMGTATITATVGDGITATVDVKLLQTLATPNVTVEKTKDEKVGLTWDAVEDAAGYEIQRTIDGEKEDKVIKVEDDTTYTDEDVKVGSTYSYEVRAIAKDNAGVYTAKSNWSKASDAVTIEIRVESVTLDKSEATLEITDEEEHPSIQLTATVEPEAAKERSVTWKSDAEKVATVDDNGLVKAVAPGKATITVTANDNGKSAKCDVTVNKKLTAPVVDAVKSEDGQSITVSWKAVENAAGYQIKRATDRSGNYEVLEVEDLVPAEGMVTYTDKFAENAAGNVYSYKVIAVGAKDSYYSNSDESKATSFIHIDEANPFGVNVATKAEVTVTYMEENEVDTSANLDNLTDGSTDAAWESKPKVGENGARIDRTVEIVADLGKEKLIDWVSLNWADAPAKEYKVYVSTDNEEWKEVADATLNNAGAHIENHTFEPQYARYVKIACESTLAYNVYKLKEIEVYTIGAVDEELTKNFSTGKTVVASMGEESAARITDGDMNTRWESGTLTAGDTPYFYIDLGEEKTFNTVNVYFEGAYAKVYDIAIATDESAIIEENITDEASWKNIVTNEIIADKPELNQKHELDKSVTARYVKFTAKEANNNDWGVKVYEMEVIDHHDSLPAKSIYLNTTEDYVFEASDETVQLYAQFLPANADATVTWTSSKPAVATVVNGKVTAVGKGVATITASAGNDIKASIDVMYLEKLETPTVTAEQTGDKTATVSWDAVEGATYELHRIVDGIEEKEVIEVAKNSYTDEKVEKGRTYAYIVRAVTKDAGVYTSLSDWSVASNAVTITLAVSGVTLDKNEAELTILPGEAAKPSVLLTATVTPDHATNKNVTWTSDNHDVATVSDGTVTAVAPGTATITVTTEDGGRTATCTVTVYEQLAAPVVTAMKGADGQSVKLEWASIANAENYQILRAVGKNGKFEELTTTPAVKKKVTSGTTTYVDKIDADALGNTYSYKVITLPAEDTYYLQSKESAATTAVQIGQQNPFGVNVALGKKVEVSSAKDGEKTAAEQVTNGGLTGLTDEDGYWESASVEGDTVPNLAYEQNCTIDLGEVYTIDDVKVYWRTAAAASDYEILVSADGETFTQVGASREAVTGKAVEMADFAFAAQEARYVRVKCNKASNYNCYTIVEVEAYTQGTVETKDGNLTDILISQDTATLKLGSKLDLFAQKLPANAKEEIKWESSDETVAKVAGGKVTSVAAGVATITATAGDKKVSCEVTVTEQLATPEVKAVMAADEKSITVSWGVVEKADAYTLLKSVDDETFKPVEDAEITIEGTAVRYTDTDVKEGKSYSYKVKATSEEEYYLASTSAATDTILIPIHVEGVKVTVDDEETSDVVLLVGGKTTLTATIAPENATNKNVIWSTNPASGVVTVGEDGKVTAVGVGEATITVVTEDGEKKATCLVTVNQQLDAPEVTAVKADDNSNITVSWPAVDNAASYKIYRAVDDGSFTEITGAGVTTKDNVVSYADTDIEEGKKYSYKVSAQPEEFYLESESEATEAIFVPISVEGVTLDKATAELFVGDELTLEATINPEEATNQTISWESSDEAIATVEDGVVTAIAVGEVTISVITEDGEKTAECVITIKKALAAPVVTATAKDVNMTISWKAVENASGYDVFKSTDGKTFTKLTSVAATATSCEDKNLATGKYYYKVVAKGAGFYVDSAESSVAIGQITTVKVTGVTMQSAITIHKGKTAVLTAAVAPANATNKAVTWTSSNPAVATVVNGTVTAVAKGTATITATTADGSKTAVCTVTVDVPASKVTLNTKKIYIVKGKSIKVKATMAPSDTTDTLTWSSSKTSVATVKNGKIKAKKVGKTTITVKTSGGKKVTCQVYVVKKATKATAIKLNKKSATIKTGNTLNLVPKVTPAKSTDFIKWKSSNKKIASVDAFGTVTAKKKGKVTITATTTSGKKVTCKVTVK